MPALSRATGILVVVAATVAVAGGAVYLAGSKVPQPASPNPTASLPGVVASPTAKATQRNPFTDPASFGLTVGPGVAGDGTIVFGLHDNATDSDKIYGLAPDGSNAWLLSGAGSCCITLSPGGTAAMVGYDFDGRTVPKIVKLPAGGSFEEDWRDFAPDVSLFPGAWTSSTFAFQGWSKTDESKTGIYLSLGNGGGRIEGTLARLTTNPGQQADIPFAFSPDGSKLLFVRETRDAEATGDLYVIGVDGSGLRRLSPDGVGVAVSDTFGPGASWSPDGTRVAFAASVRQGDTYTSTSRAYVVDVAGGDPVVLTPDGTYMTSARWSPDGAWIAYDYDNQGKDLWLVRPDGTGAHRITHTSGSCCGTWSPDSRFLLFEGNDADGAGLFIANADGSGYSRLLTLKTEYDTHWRGWNVLPARTP